MSSWPGVIVDFRLAPANVSDVEGARDLLHGHKGWALGDRNYGSPALREECQEHGLHVLAPYKHATREKRPFPPWLTNKRRRIETLFSQLIERYRVRNVRARDGWHLWSRWLRKVLSHTVALLLCQRQGLEPLQFTELVTE